MAVWGTVLEGLVSLWARTLSISSKTCLGIDFQTGSRGKVLALSIQSSISELEVLPLLLFFTLVLQVTGTVQLCWFGCCGCCVCLVT